MPDAVLTSRRNPRVMAAASLRDRRARDDAGLTLVDGVRELGRALAAGAAVTEAFVDPDRLAGPEGDALVAALAASATPVVTVAGDVLDRLAYGDRSEGVVAVVRIPPTGLDRLRLPAEPLVVVAVGVEKPGNLGAILRSADAAGADALIAADPRTDLFNPNVIRASLGTIFALPIAAGSSADVQASLRALGVRFVAARVDGSVAYADADLRGPLAIVLGSEAEGLAEAWRGEDVLAVRLPMLGVADSLNVSVAAAVLLYEARRQRDGS